MNIDIIVHENGQKAQLRSFEPDIKFPWKDEDPMKPVNPERRKQDKMMVLNWKDLHFNLIVNKEHMLYQHGSFEFQKKKNEVKQKDGKKYEVKRSVEEDHDNCNQRLQEKDMEIKKLTENLNIVTKKLKVMVEQQTKELPIHYDNRDIEELDSEAAFVRKEGYTRTNPQENSVPTLRCQKCYFTSKNNNVMKAHMVTHEKVSDMFTCRICKHNCSSKTILDRHMKTAHKSSTELNCGDCDFQAHTGRELNNHLNLKHHNQAEQGSGKLNCNICGEQFSDYWNLMNHRRDVHPERRRRCRNDLAGECERSGEECWWKHAPENTITEKRSTHDSRQSCNICDEIFTSKSFLMIHKKKEHEESVPVCRDFQRGNCEYPLNKCWYKHVTQEEQTEVVEDAQEKESSQPLGFWDLPNPAKPPEGEFQELKDIMKRAMDMILAVNQKLTNLSN